LSDRASGRASRCLPDDDASSIDYRAMVDREAIKVMMQP
jgi:hypothetical protein